jgi:hypothetical protein
VAYFNLFISLWWYGQFLKSIFSQIFPFSYSGIAIFQNSKTKKINSNFKNENFQISNFPCGINDFFGLRLPNLLKNYKTYLFTLAKNSPTVKEPKT